MLALGDRFGVMGVYSEGAVGYAGRGATTPGGGLYSGELELTRSWSVSFAFEHLWTRQLRTSLYGGYVAIEFNDVAKGLICPAGPGPFLVPVIPVGTSGLAVRNCDPDHAVWAIGSRTQWNPHPYLDIGVDVLWAHLDTAFAGLGVTTTAQGAHPAQIVQIEDQDKVIVMGRVQYNFIP
jgi:Porin subfamily